MGQTVVVGMSGGVDSSVAALRLKQQGYKVIGVTMRLLCGRLAPFDTHSEKDVADAARVCEQLGIPHRAPDFSAEFERQVVDVFAAEYAAGRTPNPCVLCNRALKFGAMWEYARALGADHIATGHYAHTRLDPATGRYQLLCSGSAKDQSYMLYSLTQGQLAHVLFPLGGMDKPQVRELAEEYRLPVAQKGDSMEICFVPSEGHSAFLRQYTGREMPHGDFVDEQGQVLGRHQGLDRYTVGQRKGLGIALGQPMYVVRLDPERNQVVLGMEGRQYADSLIASGVNYVSVSCPESPLRVTARIRYQASPAPATLTPLGEDRVRLAFDQPQRAVAPGQAVVFYDGDLLLGGGTID
ncbi:MAG: tRNA 2-thiouridine(34) synthase MnmA [Clostridia bacterium]|nr:tRNA 2-thiouridine(34) synthase MnmA [Clostridia bacterium]